MNGSKLYGLSTYFGTKNWKYFWVLCTYWKFTFSKIKMSILRKSTTLAWNLKMIKPRFIVGTEIKLQDSILWAIGSGNVLILKSGKKSNIQKVSINYCELANVVCSAKNNHCWQIYVCILKILQNWIVSFIEYALFFFKVSWNNFIFLFFSVGTVQEVI